MTQPQARQPAGVPVGGQFAASVHAESGVALERSSSHQDVGLPVGSSWHTDGPVDSLQLNAENRVAADLARQARDGVLALDAPYQRGSVWSEDQQRGLCLSLIRRLPVPAIIVNDRLTGGWADRYGHPRGGDQGEPFNAAIDGKQRIEAVQSWFDGNLALPASWFDPDDVADTRTAADGTSWVTFDDLSVRGQRRTENRWLLPVAVAHVDSIESEAEIYLLVNGAGTAQTADDMANAARVAGKDHS